MKLISIIVPIAMILMFSGVAAADIATVHGVAYEWSTFEPLDNAIVAVNSTPAQSMVAKYGVYSFELPNGTYQITASYYEDDQLTYYADDLITVSDEGSYVLDILLLPSYSSSVNTTATTTSEDVTSSTTEDRNPLIIGALLVVVVLLAILALQMKQRPQAPAASRKAKPMSHPPVTPEVTEKLPATSKEEPQDESVIEEVLDEVSEPLVPVAEPITKEEPAPAPVPSDEPVPADLQEILDILKSQGGRMTQKDMRKRLKYSEGKVSLMLLDLEKRGKIQKFKKGRGNVLFLVEPDE
ncbi:DUF7343 domain-containing protein [Methanolobus profundi]|uniref:Uncharacterized membrane protein n=1 Tax=Methanolobus profundi TaxID=487685 RepID=A0A1I4TNN2_9EURY|nr:hypothetical protein [Methanolobus profundi]SFM78266.1 Uncharacterized membrane protein [Methanolobus profundi]